MAPYFTSSGDKGLQTNLNFAAPTELLSKSSPSLCKYTSVLKLFSVFLDFNTSSDLICMCVLRCVTEKCKVKDAFVSVFTVDAYACVCF